MAYPVVELLFDITIYFKALTLLYLVTLLPSVFVTSLSERTLLVVVASGNICRLRSILAHTAKIAAVVSSK